MPGRTRQKSCGEKTVACEAGQGVVVSTQGTIGLPMANEKLNKPAASPYRFILSLVLLSIVSCGLLAARILSSDSSRYGFLAWNLFLAAVPAALAWWLASRIRKQGWANWKQVGLTLLWISFLPNSFYLITDLVHLRSNYEADFLFDVTLLTSFIIAGLIFGMTSMFIVHKEIVKRASERKAYAWVGLIFLAVSFAICLGRYTRWNTWDILLRPAGLLFDVSDRLINPVGHLQTYQTTLTLFLLIFCTYITVWEASKLLRRN